MICADLVVKIQFLFAIMKILLTVTTIVLLLTLEERGSAVTVPITGTSRSTKASEFYLGFMQNEVNLQRLATVPLYVTTEETSTVTFSVTTIKPKFVFTGQVSYNNVTIVELPKEIVVKIDRANPEREKMKGIHVKAEDGKTISIIGSNEEHATTDSFVVLPVVENPLQVRERYTILSNDYIRVSSRQALVYSEFLLVGSRNSTNVIIIPNNTNIEIPNIYNPDYRFVTAGQKVEFTLNSMETLLVTSTDDLSGTVISSSEPISVFTGHECGQVPAIVTTCDHLVEQVPPQHTWGMQFFTSPLKRESGDVFKIATTNAQLTEVNITCTETGKRHSNHTFHTLSLIRNQVFTFERGPRDYCCIESTNPLLVMQLGKGSSLNSGLGDPLLVTIPAAQQYTNNFTVVQDQSSSNHYLNIIVPVKFFEDTPEGHSRIRINNVTASMTWAPIFCHTGQICAYGTQAALEDEFATVNHENPKAGMSVTVYGLGIDVAYGYSAGYNLDPIAFPIVSLEPEEHSIRGTSGNVTLVITRRGNIHIPLTLHLTSDALGSDDPVSEVHLPSGEVRKVVTFPVVTQLLPIATEIITVVLSYSGNEMVILEHNEANITILDVLEIGFENSSYVVNESIGTLILTITATIPNPEPSPIIFKIRTLAGTARHDEDYESVDDIITLAPLEHIMKFNITIIDDNVVEQQLEMFGVLLEIAPGQKNVGGLTLGLFEIQVYIKDNDCVAMVLDPSNLTLYENDGVAAIKIHKIGLSDITTSVIVSTKDVSTSGQLDYAPLTGANVVFQPEDTELNIYIQIVADDILESDEEFLLKLTLSDDQYLCHNQSATQDIVTVTILNDDVLTFHFEKSEYYSYEDSDVIILTVLKEGYHEFPITTEVHTHSQSSRNPAADGADYIGVRKTLTFQAGQTNHSVTITLIDDNITEDSEHFTASLFSSEAGVQISSPQETVITIMDNDVIEIGLNETMYSVGEGEGEIHLAVHSKGRLERKIEVLLSTKDGSATEFADYSEHTEIIEFSSGLNVVEVSIFILDDNIFESLESFTVELKLLDQSGVELESGRGMARVNIIDDDIAVRFASREYTTTENDKSVELHIIKQGQVKRRVDIRYVIQSSQSPHESTAIANISSDVVVLDEEETIYRLVFQLIDDDVVEANELIQVKLSIVGDGVGIDLLVDTTTIIIADDDEVIIQFECQNVSICESEGHVILQIVKIGVSSVPLNIIFSTIDNQATDYIPKQETITFKRNETQKSVIVDIIDDAIYEGNETFMVTLRAVSSGVRVEKAPSSVTILDEDDFVVLRFVSLQVLVEEFQQSIQIMISKGGRTTVPVVVMVTTEDSTAKAHADYIPIAKEITFLPEDTEKLFNLTVLPDEVLENAERFDVVMSLMGHIGGSKVLDTISVIIIDSTSSLTVTLSAAKKVVTENEREITFTAEVLGHLERDIPLQFSTKDNSASSDSDYEFTSLSVNLTPDQRTFSIVVPIVDDDIVEGEESFTVMLTSSQEQVLLINSTVNVTIVDDDMVVVKFDQFEYSVNEEESFVILLVRKEGQNEIPINVAVTTEDGSATKQMDYIPLTSVITFGALDFDIRVNVSLIDDDALEDLEMFHVLLSPTTADSYSINFNSYNASVVIVDQDLISVGFSQDVLFVNEADGTVSVVVVKDGDSEIKIHVEVQLEDNSAAENVDYMQESEMIVLLPEDKVQYINISILDDNILEDTESFIARLKLQSNQVGVTLVNSDIFVSIRDNDYVTLTLDHTNVSVVEDRGTVDLAIIKLGTAAIAINVLIIGQALEAELSEDYLEFSKTLIIEPNQTLATFTIQILNDDILEETESFTVQLQTEEESVRIKEGLATILIVDDDVVRVGFEKSRYMIPEGNGSAEICIETSIAVEFEFVVFIVVSPHSASLDTDFTLMTSQVVTGGSRGFQCSVVNIIGDQITEDREEFQLQLYLSNRTLETGHFVVSPESVTVFIIDDDRIQIGFQSVSYVVNEGEHSIEVCAVVKNGTIENTSIQVDAFTIPETAEIGEDFVVSHATLLFSDANLKQCIRVSITDDSIIEMEERLFVELMYPDQHSQYELLQGSTSVVIRDNDNIKIGFSQSIYSGTESEGQITVEVLLHQPAVLSFPISVTVEVDTNNTDVGTDWSLERSSFILDDISSFLSVIINNDNRVETNDSFNLILYPFDPRPGFKPTGETAIITILDDDYAVLSFDSSSYTINEDAGMLELSVILTKGTLERNISTMISTSNLDALFVKDFIITDPIVIFPAGASTGAEQKIAVGIIDDQFVEFDENFNVELVSVDNAVQFATKSAQITIIDNDVISVKFSSDFYSVVEGEQLDLCLTLESGQLNKIAQVLIVSQSDSASNGDDYSIPAMFYVTLKPGQNQTCFTVNTVEDNLVEGEETFQLTLGSDDQAVVVSLYDTIIVHIEDNDIAEFGLDAAVYIVTESNDLIVPIRLLKNELAIPILLTLLSSDISATAGVDYLHPTAQVVFQVGVKPGSRKNVTIAALADSVVENQESFLLSLTSLSPLARIRDGRNSATGIIQDISTVTFGFETTRYFLREGILELSVCLRIEGGKIDRSLNFTLSTRSGTAQAIEDYNDVVVTDLVATDNNQKCVNIGITDDNLVEVNESFTLFLTTMESALTISPDVAKVTIIDNDKVILAMRQSHITVQESIGELEIFIELVGALQREVAILLESIDGTASFISGDYAHFSEILTFPSGSETGTMIIFRIRIEDDHLVEEEQYFTIHATSMDEAVHFEPQRENVTVYIVDNDVINVMLESTSYFLFENDTVEVCMMPNGKLEREVHFTLAMLPGSAQENEDYLAIDSHLTAFPGDDRICFSVETLEDDLVEGEEMLQLILNGNDPAVITPEANLITITIKDNDNAVFGLVNSEYIVGDNESNLTIAVHLIDNTLASPVKLKLISLDISAINRGDYVFVPTLLKFPSGSKPGDVQHVSITILSDNTVEDTKTFQLILYSLTALATIDESMRNSTVSITDQTTVKIGFEKILCSVEEDTAQQEVCIVLHEGTLDRPVDLSIVSGDGSAQAQGDYAKASYFDTYLQINEERKCINVTIIDDDLVENTETFFLTVYSKDAAVSFITNQLTMMIIDNDKVVLSLQQTNYTVRESIGQLEVKVELKGKLERNVTFSLESNDATASALSGDYTSISETLNVSPESVTGNIISLYVNIYDDLKVEELETFTIKAISNDVAVIFETEKRTAFIFIEDDDTVVVNFMSASYSVIEGDVVEVCVMLERGTLERNVQLSIFNQDDTAEVVVDYIALNHSVLLIPDESQWCFNVTTLDDGVVEGEEVLQTVLISTDPAVVIQTPISTYIYIQDSTSAVFGLEFSEYTINENAEELIVNIILLESDIALPVLLHLGPSDLSAVNGEDYSMSTFVQVEFEPMAKAGDKVNISIAILPDNEVEDQETFRITLSSSSPLTSVADGLTFATITIIDQSAITLGFEESTYYVHEEDSTLEVCVCSQGGLLNRPINLTFISSDGSASASMDYSMLFLTTSLFESSGNRLCIHVTIIDDLFLENDENFTLLLTSTDRSISMKLNTTLVTILDNDVVALILQPSHFTINESSQYVEVTVQLLGSLEREVSIILESNDGTASSLTGDYKSFSHRLVFPSGSMNGSTVIINVTTIDDFNLEDVEYFTVHAISMDASAHFNYGRNSTTFLIEDNDFIKIMFESASYSVSEGGTVEVCATVESGQLERNVQLSIASIHVSAQEGYDYKPILTSLILFPGENTSCFSIEALDDEVVEGYEIFKVVLSSHDKAVAISTIDTAVITIRDFDRAVTGLELSQYFIEENDEYFVVSIVLLEKTLSVPISLQLTTTDVTATTGIDYISSSKLVNFPTLSKPGHRQNISVVIPLSDNIVEQTESFQVHLTSLTSLAVVKSHFEIATVNIADRSLVDIGFEEHSYYVAENENQIELCIVLRSGHLDRSVNLTLSTSNNSAQSPKDYTDVVLNTTFNGDRKCVYIVITDDNIVEDNELFLLVLNSTDVSVTINLPLIGVTIIDDDHAIIEFQQAQYTVSESSRQLDLDIRLKGSLERNVALTVESRDQTASVDSGDYTAVTETLTFPSGSVTGATLTVMVEIGDDSTVEDKEYFTVQLISMDVAIQINEIKKAASIFIEDDDIISVRLETASYSVVEGETTKVCAKLENGLLGRDVELSIFGLPGSAQEKDYSMDVFNFSLSSTKNQSCIPVKILNDNLVEGEETFNIILSSNDPAVITSTPDSATIYIDDNNDPVLGFEQTDYFVDENDGSLTIAVTVQQNELHVPISVLLRAEDFTAINKMDYVFMDTNLVFPSGSMPGYVKNITFMILPDRVVENTEIFKLNILQGGPRGTIHNLGNATVKINDQTVVNFGFETSEYSLREGTSFLEVCIFFEGGQLDRPVDIMLYSTDRTALAKSDYVRLSTSDFKTVDGNTMCIDITILDDSLVERNETFTLDLISNDTAVHIISQTATVVIMDNDQVTFGFVHNTYTAKEEKGQLEVSIQLHGGQGLDRDIVVHLESSDESATASSDDYIPFRRALTFPQGSLPDTVLPFVIDILDDSFVEEVEYFTIHIISSDNAVQSQISKENVTIFIDDDDSIYLIMESSVYSVAEGEVVQVCVMAESGELQKVVQFSIFSHPASAQEEDYNAVFISRSLRPGESRVCFFIETLEDNTVEGREDFHLMLNSQDPAVTIATPGLASITIEDNDVAVFGLEHNTFVVGESSVNFSVSVLLLEKDLSLPLTLQLSASDVTATNGIDYLCNVMDVTFVTGSKPGDFQQIFIPLIFDHIIENVESFQVRLSSVSPLSIIDTLREVSTVDIFDTSAAFIGFEDLHITTAEGVPNLKLCLRVRGGELDRPVNVSVITSGNAQVSTDYTILTEIVINSNNNGRKCLDIAIIDDLIVEDDEVFTLTLTSLDSAISLSPDTTTVLIIDNDRAIVALQHSSYTVSEGDGVILLSVEIVEGTLEKSISFSIESKDGNASAHTGDYETLSTTLTFPSDSTSGSVQTLLVEIGDDLLVEGLESFTIHISAIDSSLAVRPEREDATIFIVDNDIGVDVKLEYTSYSVAEGRTIKVCVILEDGQFERNRQLSISSQSDSAQEDDYVAVNKDLILQPSEERTCIIVEILDDDLVEGDEVFQLILMSSDPAVVIVSNSITNIQILDNDSARFGFESLDYWLTEGPGIVSIPIVLLEHELAVPVSVQFSTADMSATWGADYVYERSPVTFLPGDKAGDIHMIFIAISPDTTVEATETFQLGLSCQNHLACIDDGLGVCTIYITDQTTTTIGFERVQYMTREDMPQLQVCLVLQDGRQLARFVNFTVSTRDGTAHAPEDYLPLEFHSSFSPTNGNIKCLQLTIVDDSRLERNEVLSLTLTSTDPSVLLDSDQTFVRIFDNDQVIVALQQRYYVADETTGRVELIVQLLGDVERDASVMLESRDGTAIASHGDYQSLSKVLTFIRGSNSGSSHSVTVYIQDDPLVEQLEFFTIHTSSLDAGVQIQQSSEDIFVYIISDDVISSDAISIPMGDNDDDNEDETCTRRSCNTRTRTRSRKHKTTSSSSDNHSRSRSTASKTSTNRTKKDH